MVSVVMATYNGKQYIYEQMDSIRMQTQAPDEVIISDDCSTDGTLEIIEKYISDFNLSSWKLVRNEDNKGFYENFFFALSYAKGDTIYLSDQDDIWNLEKIKEFEEYYANNPNVLMIQSNICFIDGSGSRLKKQEIYHKKKSRNTFENLTIEDMCKFAGSGYTMSFRRIVSEKVFGTGLEKERELFEFHDILLGLTSICLGNVALSMDIVDFHRVHADNVTQKKDQSYISDRNKEKQVRIVNRRSIYFDILSNFAIEEQKKKHLERCSKFAKSRSIFITEKSIREFINILKNIDLYASKLGIITDSMYALGMEKLLQNLLK